MLTEPLQEEEKGGCCPMELGGFLLLTSTFWRGSERSKEETARLLEPTGILWGLFFLSTVCRSEGMNKRVRQIYRSRSLAAALYLYSGSRTGGAGVGGGDAGTQGEKQTLDSLSARIQGWG